MKLWEEDEVIWASRLGASFFGTDAWAKRLRNWMGERNTPYTMDDWRKDTANIAKIVEPALEDLWFEIFECEEDFLEHIDPGGPRVSQLRMFSRMFMWYWIEHDSEMETADADDMETMAAMASKVLTAWRATLIQQVAA